MACVNVGKLHFTCHFVFGKGFIIREYIIDVQHIPPLSQS